MGATWRCDDCGTSYKVAWLSHCPRCEAMPPPKRTAAKRGTRMPKANKTGGASNVWERAVEAVEHEAEKLVGELRGEYSPEDAPAPVAPEPVAAPVEPEPAPEVAPAAPEAAPAPAPVQSTPATPAKGSAA